MRTNAIANSQIAEEAADWAVRIDGGHLSGDEREGLAKWLTASPTHVSELILSSALISGLEHIDSGKTLSTRDLLAQSAPEVIPLFDDANSLAGPELDPELGPEHAANNFGTAANDGALPNPARRFSSLSQFAAAASVAVALVAGFAVYSESRSPTFDAPVDGQMQQLSDARDPNFYTTAIGEQRSIALEDGSIVYMNTNSQMRATMTATGRRIDLLRGEAMFEVAHDTDRPFRVFAHGSMAQAVGTKFNVETTVKGINVVVVEGRVLVLNKADKPTLHRADIRSANRANSKPLDSQTSSLTVGGQSSGSNPVMLLAGDQASLGVSLKSPQVTHANIAAVTSWRMRQLLFEHEGLASIASEFNRYNRKKLVLSDSSIADMRFSGLFSADDPDSFTDFLALTAGVEVDTSDPEQTIIKSSRH